MHAAHVQHGLLTALVILHPATLPACLPYLPPATYTHPTRLMCRRLPHVPALEHVLTNSTPP